VGYNFFERRNSMSVFIVEVDWSDAKGIDSIHATAESATIAANLAMERYHKELSAPEWEEWNCDRGIIKMWSHGNMYVIISEFELKNLEE